MTESEGFTISDPNDQDHIRASFARLSLVES
jgi:hypothetical protein